MRNARLGELQAEIKIGGRNMNNLRYEDDTTLMAESEEELNSLLSRVKEQQWKSQLKTKYEKKTHGPITSWQIEGERWKEWQISSSWALKALQMVTAAIKSEDICFLAGKLWQT